MTLIPFRWIPDPEFDGDPAPCHHCGGATEAMRCEPDRGELYLTHIRLCVRPGCRRAWPYLGARIAAEVRAGRVTFPCCLCGRCTARTNGGSLLCLDCQGLPAEKQRAAFERHLGMCGEQGWYDPPRDEGEAA